MMAGHVDGGEMDLIFHGIDGVACSLGVEEKGRRGEEKEERDVKRDGLEDFKKVRLRQGCRSGGMTIVFHGLGFLSKISLKV
jgi:hypothetical protein